MPPRSLIELFEGNEALASCSLRPSAKGPDCAIGSSSLQRQGVSGHRPPFRHRARAVQASDPGQGGGPPTVCRLLYTHSVSHAHFPDTFSLRGVHTSRTRMAQGVCSAHVISLHLTLSILMFHPPSLLFPDGHLETTFPTLASAPSLPNCSRSESAGPAHFRTSGVEFGYLADPTHSTGCEPKELNKITSADGDTTPINDPNYDNISDFSKITRQNTALFDVSTMLETSFSHVSHGNFALQRASQESMPRETVAGQEREKEGLISVAESMSKKSRRNSIRSHSLQTQRILF